jgi:ABC-type branched-subunit amino acid transport system ATPase component
MVSVTPTSTIIRMHGAGTPPNDSYHSPIRKVSLTVDEGALVIIRVEPGHQNSPFSDLAQGITSPAEGVVEYRGRPWNTLTDIEVIQARGRMGRVFDEAAWISNISMLDNILLARRYHSQETDQMLLAEALQWCRRFGFKSIPQGRPGTLPLEHLKICQWIRACMQSPRLLLLEHPERNVSSNSVKLLAEAVDDLRRTGAGVLWVTDREIPPMAADLPKPTIFVKRGDELVAEEKK